MSKKDEDESLDLMTPEEVSKEIRMSESWLEKQRMEKKGIPYLRIGKKVYYERREVHIWARQQRQLS